MSLLLVKFQSVLHRLSQVLDLVVGVSLLLLLLDRTGYCFKPDADASWGDSAKEAGVVQQFHDRFLGVLCNVPFYCPLVLSVLEPIAIGFVQPGIEQWRLDQFKIG